MNAASRGHRSVLDFLITLPAVDLSIRNSQNECLYDVAAGKGDLSTCRVIETYERDQWSHSHRGGRPLGVLLGSLLTLCSVEFDPIIQHTIIPCVVTENSRVNSRSRLPDPRILTSNIDPPQFTPASKEDIFLPRTSDASSTNWVWISKWTVFEPDPDSCPGGWKFAQRWDAPESDWVGDATSLTPISRAGLVARRTWFRIMKKCSVGQDNLGEVETSENEVSETEIPLALAGTSRISVDRSVLNSQAQPVRSNSMGARLVGLVTGTVKGK